MNCADLNLVLLVQWSSFGSRPETLTSSPVPVMLPCGFRCRQVLRFNLRFSPPFCDCLWPQIIARNHWMMASGTYVIVVKFEYHYKTDLRCTLEPLGVIRHRRVTWTFNPCAMLRMAIILYLTGWPCTTSNRKKRHNNAVTIFICK